MMREIFQDQQLPDLRLASVADLRPNPDNPREISEEMLGNLIASLREFPQMLKYRPIICDENWIVVAGNQRLEAAKRLGWQAVPAMLASDLSEEELHKFIVLDNQSFGAWSWDKLLGGWELPLLEGYGIEIPGVEFDGFDGDWDLPDGEKDGRQRLTFTLSDDQANFIQEQISKMQASKEFKAAEGLENDNRSGNALYLIVQEWAKRKK